MSDLSSLLQHHFPTLTFSADFSLSSRSYFQIGGPAELFCSVKERQQAIDLLLFCQAQQIKFTLIGGASNVLIADEGIRGLVVNLDLTDLQISTNSTNELLCQAECGVKTANLVAKIVNAGGQGMEGFVGVPGTVGGAIYNNAHYLTSLISDHLHEVEALDLEQGQVVKLSAKDCQFAYEHSIFQDRKNLIIFSALFVLPQGVASDLRQAMRAAILKREQTQPLNLPSCGCVFRNPANTPHLRQLFPQFSQAEFVPAGFLIDQAGMKGAREGDIQVSEKHAAFLVNLGHGTASQVKHMIEKIKQTVRTKFEIELKEEIFYLN